MVAWSSKSSAAVAPESSTTSSHAPWMAAPTSSTTRIPRQTVTVKKRREISFYVIIPAVPAIIGVILFAVTWSQISQTRDRLARGQVAIGKVVGYEDRYDYDEGTADFYPIVEYSLAQGGLSTFTSSTGAHHRRAA